MNVSFEVVRLYYGDIYTGYCTKPDLDVELHQLNDWKIAYAIKVLDGGTPQYFLLGDSDESLYVTEID